MESRRTTRRVKPIREKELRGLTRKQKELVLKARRSKGRKGESELVKYIFDQQGLDRG